MVEVQKLIPKVYNQSRDFSVFTGVMQIILNELEFKTKVLEKLPAEDLLIGELSTYPALRTSFRQLLKYKGTQGCLVHSAYLCGGTTLSFDTENEYLDIYFSGNIPTYFDRNHLENYPGIDKGKLVYWGEYVQDISQIYLMHINVKDQSSVDFDLFSKLQYFIKPVDTIIYLDKGNFS